MSRAHLARIVLVALLGIVALPAAAVAGDPVTVTGTVTRDDSPVAGVEVAVTVDASDLILSTTTTADGAFSLVIDAAVGSRVVLRATGPTTTTGPGKDGCVHHVTPVGSVTMTLETLTPDAVALPLDKAITSAVCSATARPHVTAPATDSAAPADARGPGSGDALAVLGMLGLLAGASLVTRRGRTRWRDRA